MRTHIKVDFTSPTETARRCDAFYSCSKVAGERLGPLVAYAGTYDGPDGKQLHFVGDIYFNFAKVEPHANAMNYFADLTFEKLLDAGLSSVSDLVLTGAPIGGYRIADTIGARHEIDVITAEKRVTVAGTSDRKEESETVFSRHTPQEGDKVVIVEDVCNNFKTTAPFVGNILMRGAEVVAILCVLNRSPKIDSVWQHPGNFTLPDGKEMSFGAISLPVISLIRMPYAKYRQDDPAVASDVARGNVVWNPKRTEEWAGLMTAMQAHA